MQGYRKGGMITITGNLPPVGAEAATGSRNPQAHTQPFMIIIIFGVAGAGKTLIGSRLAAELGWAFHDADSFHGARTIAMMKRGIPLTDEDRQPWLDRLCGLLREAERRGEDAVLACSALKDSYRKRLLGCAEAKLVYLKGDYALIRQRLRERQGHFIDPGLLESQYETLEEPCDEAVVVDVSRTPDEIVAAIRKSLNL